MALSVNTTAQNSVAYRVYSDTYANLPTYRAGIVDEALTQALTIVEQTYQLLAVDVSSDAPDEWMPWFIAEATYHAALTEKDEREPALRRLANSARDQALNTYRKTALSASTTASTTSLATIRESVILRLLPRGIMPQTEVVDDAVRWANNLMWSAKDWSFRKRSVNLTFGSATTSSVQTITDTENNNSFTLTWSGETTDSLDNSGGALTAASIQAALLANSNLTGSDVAVTGSAGGPWAVTFGDRYAGQPVSAITTSDANVTVTQTTTGSSPSADMDVDWDKIATRKLYYSDSSGINQFCEWASADLMERMNARNDNAGRPTLYRISRNDSNVLVWEFYPEPDQEYTLRTEVTISGDATFNTFPTEFQPMLVDLSFAKVMVDLGITGATKYMDNKMTEMEDYLSRFDDVTVADDVGPPIDVYGDVAAQSGTMQQGGQGVWP